MTARFEDIHAYDHPSSRKTRHLMNTIRLAMSQNGRRIHVMKFPVSKKGNATILDIIRLDAVITSTIDLLRKNGSELVQKDANKIVVCDFAPLVDEKDVLNYVE